MAKNCCAELLVSNKSLPLAEMSFFFFPPVGLKGNLSLLDIFIFSRGLNQMEDMRSRPTQHPICGQGALISICRGLRSSGERIKLGEEAVRGFTMAKARVRGSFGGWRGCF